MKICYIEKLCIHPIYEKWIFNLGLQENAFFDAFFCRKLPNSLEISMLSLWKQEKVHIGPQNIHFHKN